MSGRPVEASRARSAERAVAVRPSALGGHSWHAMSFHPATGLVYIPAIDLPGGYGEETIDVASWESPRRLFGTAPDLRASALSRTPGAAPH